MATSTVPTNSMLLTPQAVDDIYTMADGKVLVMDLDVLSNDLGGAAKILWAVTKGSETDVKLDIDDLISQDTVGTMPDCTELGAKVSILNGKLHYDASSLANSVKALGAGQSLTDHMTYSIRMSNGTLSVATVTVILQGVNDKVVFGPVQIGSASLTGGITEDKSATSQETTSGSLAFTDADWSDTHTVSTTPKGSSYVGQLTASLAGDSQNNGTGHVNWTYKVNNADIQFLGTGESLQQKYILTVDDGHGGLASQDVVVTITGTNDGPTVTAGSTTATGSVTEDATSPALSTTGLITFNDVDLTDVHTTSVKADAGNRLGGTLTMGSASESSTTESGTVGWTYNVANGATQYLGAGETASEKFTVTIDDGHGGKVDQVVSVTVTGTNDGPTVTAGSTTATGSVTEDASGSSQETTSGSISFTDVDLSDTHNVTVNPSGPGYFGALTALVSNDSIGNGTGQVNWQFTLNNTDIQTLNASDQIHQTYVITLNDGHGGTVQQQVNLYIKGTDDNVPPIVTTVPTPVTDGGDPNDYDSMATATNPIVINDQSSPSTPVTLTGSILGDTIHGNNGTDIIYGGASNDTLYGDNEGDVIYGGSGNDSIYGGNSGDKLFGGSGSDTIYGDTSNDSIYGGYGADTLTSGDGSDTFFFVNLKDTGDTILDFVSGIDKIDLSAINASSTASSDTTFLWGGTVATAHGVWYADDTTNHMTNIYLDTDGNLGTAEMALKLSGDLSLTTNDFLL